ncbi:hypothetical protein [Tranquillimonas alkanivorans]|uniref:Uncharacterized protein n=1 Tax=Tranquillimonas alkanivorans TaxID=441119 RepID=A0A1I5V2C8_9RHOB|nr:hypothetical protein [Tranquillimonas alkanivorans]SFQ01106.1 hypothetical protein SAMN04488047_1266 [Tranquillimonas alkanivorans]
MPFQPSHLKNEDRKNAKKKGYQALAYWPKNADVPPSRRALFNGCAQVQLGGVEVQCEACCGIHTLTREQLKGATSRPCPTCSRATAGKPSEDQKEAARRRGWIALAFLDYGTSQVVRLRPRGCGHVFEVDAVNLLQMHAGSSTKGCAVCDADRIFDAFRIETTLSCGPASDRDAPRTFRCPEGHHFTNTLRRVASWAKGSEAAWEGCPACLCDKAGYEFLSFVVSTHTELLMRSKKCSCQTHTLEWDRSNVLTRARAGRTPGSCKQCDIDGAEKTVEAKIARHKMVPGVISVRRTHPESREVEIKQRCTGCTKERSRTFRDFSENPSRTIPIFQCDGCHLAAKQEFVNAVAAPGHEVTLTEKLPGNRYRYNCDCGHRRDVFFIAGKNKPRCRLSHGGPATKIGFVYVLEFLDTRGKTPWPYVKVGWTKNPENEYFQGRYQGYGFDAGVVPFRLWFDDIKVSDPEGKEDRLLEELDDLGFRRPDEAMMKGLMENGHTEVREYPPQGVLEIYESILLRLGLKIVDHEEISKAAA